MNNQLDLALVIEDDFDISVIFSKALEFAEFQTEVIDSGEQAMAYLQDVVPQMIILDLNLPGVEGKDILTMIRADERFSATHVIVATANQNPDQAIRDMADLVLIKPITFSQMRDFSQVVAGIPAKKAVPRDDDRPSTKESMMQIAFYTQTAQFQLMGGIFHQVIGDDVIAYHSQAKFGAVLADLMSNDYITRDEPDPGTLTLRRRVFLTVADLEEFFIRQDLDTEAIRAHPDFAALTMEELSAIHAVARLGMKHMTAIRKCATKIDAVQMVREVHRCSVSEARVLVETVWK